MEEINLDEEPIIEDEEPIIQEPIIEIFNADCLEKMKELKDKSVDLIFCDLPYGQTNCKWDTLIDLEEFWNECMRIKKLNTPIIHTTTTKFGVSLIQSAPKKCPFRYDLIWVKSNPVGFLNARRMPLRKHEMVYVFYEKLPFYNLSSHTHKFTGKKGKNRNGSCYHDVKDAPVGKYEPPLPTSIIKEDNKIYENGKKDSAYGKVTRYESKSRKKGESNYDPPLPTSIVKEDPKDVYNYKNRLESGKLKKADGKWEPPLPDSILEINSERGKHSTQKPVKLLEFIIKYYSKEGDTVFDPTMGCGTTGVASKNLNRNFIGIEKDEKIFKDAEERLK